VLLVWWMAPWLAVSVAGGDGFTCALTRAGTVQCWGKIPAADLRGVSQIAAGGHACAVLRGGASCWGGQYGSPTPTVGGCAAPPA
jgi:hypothetical protein